MSRITLARTLGFAASLELGTGFALLVAPTLVITLLAGEGVSRTAVLLGRFLGIALLGLGLAGWPGRHGAAPGPAVRGLLAYNALIALYLARLGAAGLWTGLLLWPAVALHAMLRCCWPGHGATSGGGISSPGSDSRPDHRPGRHPARTTAAQVQANMTGMTGLIDALRAHALSMPLLGKFAIGMLLVAGMPVLSRLVRLPAIVGLLLSGVLIGPHGLDMLGHNRPSPTSSPTSASCC